MLAGRRALGLIALLFIASAVAFAPGCKKKSTGTPTDGGPGDGGGLDGGGLDAGTDGGGGDGGADAGTDAQVIPPSITSVQPNGVPCNQETELLILGTSLDASSTVELVNCDTNEVLDLGAGAVTGTTEIRVTVGPLADCATRQGLYKAVVTSASGTLESVCTVFLLNHDPPTVTDVSPPFAYAGDPNDGILSDRLVAVTGTGFIPTPSVRFVNVTNPNLQFESTQVSFVSDTSLTVLVPSESRSMPVGDYHVVVTNPTLLEAQWLIDTNNDGQVDSPGIFKVTGTAPPQIDFIDPQRPAGNTCPLDLVLNGSGFTNASRVILIIDPNDNCPQNTTEIVPGQCEWAGARCEDADNAANCSGDRLVVTIQTCPPQGFYPVRVLNADGQFDDYFFFEVTESAGQHWNDSFVTEANGLTFGRERVAAVAGFDAFAGTHLYVSGGIDSARTTLDTVERATVSIFGQLGGFDVTMQYYGSNPGEIRQPNTHVVPRQGHALVRVGRWLYAIGGASSDTFTDATTIPALDTVEQARILGYEGVPLLATPQTRDASGLALGSWYYQVSAIGPDGETLPSFEANAKNTRGVLEVCWVPEPDATAYNVYRSRGPDGRSGTTRLLAAGVAGTANGNNLCFTDTGVGDHLAAPGFLRATPEAGGSLAVGDWVYIVSAVDPSHETLGSYALTATSDAVNASLRVRWSAPTNVPARLAEITYNIYRTPAVNGTAAAVQLLATGITGTSYLDDGSVTPSGNPPGDGITPLPPGSLSKWRIVTDFSNNPIVMNAPREGLDAVALKITDGDTTTTGEPTYIYVGGGRVSNDIVSNGIYLDTVERIRVYSNGTLDATMGWDEMLPTFNHPRVFYSLVTNGLEETAPPPPDQPPCTVPDADGDGFVSCLCPGGDDCNDGDPNVHPGAAEICEDGIDQDCDAGCNPGNDLACPPCTNCDGDGDGHCPPPCGDDCDDTNPNVYPGAPEAPDCDGIDQDCNGEDRCIIVPKEGDSGPRGSAMRKESTAFACGPRILQMCTSPANSSDPTLVDYDALQRGWYDLQRPQQWLTPYGNQAPPPPPEPGGEAADATPIYLVACQGDSAFNGPNNGGTNTFDVCQIDSSGHWDPGNPNFNPNYGGLINCDDPGNGTLPDAGLWALQNSTMNQARMGHRALLYGPLGGGALFILGGVTSENVNTTSISVGNSAARRFLWNPASTDPTTIVGSSQGTGAGAVNRGLYAIVRVNGRIFVIGGTDGTNPLDTVISLSQ